MIGHGAFFQVEATRHHPNEFVLLVGDTAKARKGSSFDHVARLLTDAHPASPSRVTTGLSSGEGLIWAVRDPQDHDPGAARQTAARRRARVRLRPESHGREISTLSPTLRSAWDGRPLALLTRTAPATRDQRAHRDHRSHHPDRARPAHHHRRARQRIPEPVPDLRLPPRPAAPRRRRPRTARKAPASAVPRRRAASTPTPPDRSRSPRTRASCGGTPTRSSPSRSTGSPGTSPPAPRRTRSASRSSTRCSTAKARSARASARRARALGLRLPLRRAGRSGKRPATRSPNRLHAALIRAPDGLTRTQLCDHCTATSPPTNSTEPSKHSPPPAAPATPHHHRRPPRRTLARQPPSLNPRPLTTGEEGRF